MEAGRGVAEGLLGSMDVPYYVAAPLLLQDMASWQQSGVTGLQSVVLYALPELDGAVDAVVLGALEEDDIVLEQERVTKLCRRVSRRIQLRNTPTRDRKVGLVLYGFPPNVGAVGTAALLNVPRSLDAILHTLQNAGYDAPPGLYHDKNHRYRVRRPRRLRRPGRVRVLRRLDGRRVHHPRLRRARLRRGRRVRGARRVRVRRRVGRLRLRDAQLHKGVLEPRQVRRAPQGREAHAAALHADRIRTRSAICT